MTKKIAITMGDPAGIGPEVSLKALASNRLPKNTNIFIIGNTSAINSCAKNCNITTEIIEIKNVNNFVKNKINVMNIKTLDNFKIGNTSANCGKASYDYIIKGIDLAKSKTIDAVVTGPINKTSLKLAEINYPGHTEIFAEETNTQNFSMMFMLNKVCVSHVTTHCSLLEAINLIKPQRVLNHIKLLNTTLISLGIKNPSIAVSGLNPHAGESGLFGNEEIECIMPAITECRKDGINLSDPLPPDTVFNSAFKGNFDGVVSMLHDHGFVALKSKDFAHGVNITIGLPIIRTSVGHGTAFDIANKYIASEESMISAIQAAYRLSYS